MNFTKSSESLAVPLVLGLALALHSACDMKEAPRPASLTTPQAVRVSGADSAPSQSVAETQIDEPYAPQEISWQDIHLGMSEADYLRCIRAKVPGDLKNTWKNDGSIRTLDNQPYIRIDFHDHDAKEEAVLNNGDRFMPLPNDRILISDEPITHLDTDYTTTSGRKETLLNGAEATFVSNRLVVLKLAIASSKVSMEEARDKFEKKYGKQFQPVRIRTYTRPDLQVVTTPKECLVLSKDKCSICLSYPVFPGGPVDRSEYKISLQDDTRIMDLVAKSKAKIDRLKKEAEHTRKAKAKNIPF